MGYIEVDNKYERCLLFMLIATSEEVYSIYDDELRNLCERRSEIVEHPDKDFTRRTKVTIPVVMNSLVSAGAEGMKLVVQDFTDNYPGWFSEERVPFISTFTEARKKLKTEAFSDIFQAVTGRLSGLAKWAHDEDVNYHLLPRAVDGTSFPYDSSSEYSDEKYSARGTRAWVQECTAVYDLETGMFTDAVIHGCKGKNTGEPADFCTMIDRAEVPDGTRILYIADRAFAVPNVLAHLQESGQFFLIRDKDVDAAGFVGSLNLPEEAFDVDMEIRIGRSVPCTPQTSDGRWNRCIAAKTRFDYIDPGSNRTYTLHLRVVRLCINGTWVVLLTNLPRDKYSVDDLRNLYAMRWGEEVAFRDMKYTLGTLSFHSRLDKLITQEIWAKLLLYNMCAVIAASAPAVVLESAGDGPVPNCVREFQSKEPGRIAVDFVVAVHNIRLSFIRRSKTSVRLAEEIVMYKEKIDPGRHEKRNKHARRRFYLNYRAA